MFLLLSCCGDTQIGSNLVPVNCSANQIIDQGVVSPLHFSSSDDLAYFGAYYQPVFSGLVQTKCGIF